MKQFLVCSTGFVFGGVLVFLFMSQNSTKEQFHRQDSYDHPQGHPNSKSIAFYVGSNLTKDKATLLAGFGHEPSSHWLEIIPAQQHSKNASVEVGATKKARIPGQRITIPQVEKTFRYITSHYSQYAGFPPPLLNGGLNEYGLAARDVWSPSRPELVAMTRERAQKIPQRGLTYSDLSRAVMERATTAREAAQLVGELIDTYGYTTYGGNSHLFADHQEGWVLVNFAAQGLWAAKRLGPDDVYVLYPGYIGDFPTDYQKRDDYMGSENLLSFAKEQGWWDGKEPFNLHRVYAQEFPAIKRVDDKYPEFYTRYRNPPLLEEELRNLAPLSLADMMAYVRDPRWSNDFSGYGQVAQLKKDTPKELKTLWVAITSAITTPFVPVPIGAESIPAEFRQHRYMTKDASSHFIDPDYAHLEATRFATRQFKRLLYYTCERPEEFLATVTKKIEKFEQKLIDGVFDFEKKVLDIEDQKERSAFITEKTNSSLLESLDLGEKLTNEVELETKEKFGIRLPRGEQKNGLTTPATSQHMARKGWRAMVHCYQQNLGPFPRRHGEPMALGSSQ